MGCILLHDVHVRISHIIHQQSQLKDFLLMLLYLSVSLHVSAPTGHPQVNTIYYFCYKQRIRWDNDSFLEDV
jgi:hypothetical protein